MSLKPSVPPVLRPARPEDRLATDYQLLKEIFWKNLGTLAALLFMGLVFFSFGAAAFWIGTLGARVFGVIFMAAGTAIGIFAVVTVHSTCSYDYTKARLRKQGIRVEGRLKGKSSEEIEDGQFLYRLQYAYSWQGRPCEGEEIIEDKVLFDKLHANMRLPVTVLGNSPETSMLPIESLRKQLLKAAAEPSPDEEDGTPGLACADRDAAMQ